MALPPPQATTTSASCCRAASTAARATVMVGSPSTGQRNTRTPVALIAAMTSADGASDRPVTTIARRPGIGSARRLSSWRHGQTRSRWRWRRRTAPAYHPRSSGDSSWWTTPDTWFRHQRRDGVAPREVVRRGLVGDGGFLVLVDLEQHEAGRFVALLQDVEPGDAGLEAAVARVLLGGGLERRHGVGIHVDVDDRDVHGRSPSGRPMGAYRHSGSLPLAWPVDDAPRQAPVWPLGSTVTTPFTITY